MTIDSVYRFKGQSAPAVVFTEIDFEALDALATRKLLVGATRAIMKLVLALSDYWCEIGEKSSTNLFAA